MRSIRHLITFMFLLPATSIAQQNPAHNSATVGAAQIRTSAELSSGVIPTDYGYPPGDVRRYGARGNGSTDDSRAIQAALNQAAVGANRTPVYLAAGANYRLASGITIPPTVYVYGLGASPDPDVGWGTRLTCDLQVPVCVTMGKSGASPGSGLSYVSVWRAAGIIPPTSIGIEVLDGTGVNLSHVSVMRHGIGVEALADGLGGGLGLNIDNLYTGAIKDAHFVQDTWAEVRIINSRFGSNGGHDYLCSTYVRLQGGSASERGAGPNGLYVANSQFNQGDAFPRHWLEFVSQAPRNVGAIEDFKFANVHVEGIAAGGAFIYSDSSFNRIIGLAITNSWFSPDLPGTSFLALNPASSPNSWHISNSDILTGFSLMPAEKFSDVQLIGNHVSGLIAIKGASGSSYVSSGNTTAGGFSYAGNYASLVSVGDQMMSGSFTFSATGTDHGRIRLEGDDFSHGAWAPVIIPDSGSGITYVTQVGTYEIHGSIIELDFKVVLSGLGTANGNVYLGGLPFAPGVTVSSAITGDGGSAIPTALQGVTLTAPLSLQLLEGGGSRRAQIQTWTASGQSVLKVSQMTNRTSISGHLMYEWQ